LFFSYLQDRQQRALINNSSSSVCNVSVGVPQGSLLGTLLLVMVVIGIVLPLKVKLNYGISVFENSIISVLSGLKDINHFYDHSSSSFKS
jgi:hypothetical protein